MSLPFVRKVPVRNYKFRLLFQIKICRIFFKEKSILVCGDKLFIDIFQVDDFDEEIPYSGSLRLSADPEENSTPIVLNSSRLLRASTPSAEGDTAAAAAGEGVNLAEQAAGNDKGPVA